MVVLATIVCAVSAPADAADVALVDAWGFLAEPPAFVFEEYGCQDGSGWGYSSIYAVDLENDRWLEGTPARARVETETCAVLDARARAAADLAGILPARSELMPAVPLAYHARTDEAADRTSLRFRYPTWPGPAPEGPSWTVRLSEHPVEDAPGCAGLGEQAIGFEITLDPPDGDPRTIHADQGIPDARGCPLAYALTAAYVPADFGGLPDDPVRGALLVSYYSFGFEGTDRRFLALPLVLDPPAR